CSSALTRPLSTSSSTGCCTAPTRRGSASARAPAIRRSSPRSTASTATGSSSAAWRTRRGASTPPPSRKTTRRRPPPTSRGPGTDMPDLLLTHGYFLDEDEKEREIMKPYPTLGLLYISSYLRRAGFAVEIFDTTFARRDELFARFAAGPGVVGVYTNLMTRRPVLAVLAAAKVHGWTVVLGGPEAANYPAEYLSRGADVVVAGEGEATMAELLPALAARGPHRLHGVAGTIFRDEAGEIVENPERAQIPDLDSLPSPDRGQIDQARYVDVWRRHHG